MSAESTKTLPDWAIPAPAQSLNRRPWKLFGWIAALIVLVVCAAAVFLWLDVRPTPTVLLLVPARSSDAYAPDHSTAEAFVEPFRQRVPALSISSGVSKWKAAIEELVARQPRNVMLVVLGVGGHDELGPYVLHDQSAQREDAFSVNTLLEAMQRLPARTPKLIVFDVTVEQATPSRGQIHNSFAFGLNELNETIRAIPNLVVVCSSGVDEISAVSEIHGKTAFQQAMIDQWSAKGDALADGRLFTNEWLNGVIQQTTCWTAEHRGQSQIPLLLPTGVEAHRRSEQQVLGFVDRTVSPVVAPIPFEPSTELIAARQRYLLMDNSDWHPTQWVGFRWMRYGAWLWRAEQASVLGHTQEVQRTLNEAEQERLAILHERDLLAPAQTTLLSVAMGATTDVGGYSKLLDELLTCTEARRIEVEAAWTAAITTSVQRHQATRELLLWLATDPLPRRTTAARATQLMGTDLEVTTVEQQALELFLRYAPQGKLSSKTGLAQRQMFLLRLEAEACWAKPGAEAARPWIDQMVRLGDRIRCSADDRLFAEGDDPSIDAALSSGQQAMANYVKAAEQFRITQRFQRTWAVIPVELTEHTEVLAAWPTDSTETPPHWQREQRFRALEEAWAQWHELHAELFHQSAKPLEVLDKQAELLIAKLANSRRLIIEVTSKLLNAPPAVDRAELIHRGHLVRACLKWSGCPRRTELLREWHRLARELHLLAVTTSSPITSIHALSARERAFAEARWRGLLDIAKYQPDHTNAERLRFQFEQFARQANPHHDLMSANAGVQFYRLTAESELNDWRGGKKSADQAILAQVKWPYSDIPEPMISLRKQRAAELLHWQAERTEAEFLAGLPGQGHYYQQAAKRLRQRARELAPQVTGRDPCRSDLPAVPELPRQRTITDEQSPILPLSWQTTLRPDLYHGWMVTSDGASTWLTDSSSPGMAKPVTITTLPSKTPFVPRLEKSTTTVSAYFRGHVLQTTTAIDWYRTPDQTMLVRRPAPGAAVAIRGDAAMLAKLGRGAGQLIFAVDATGSLAQPDDDATQPAPFKKVCDTLEALLLTIPADVQVRVVMFGHRQVEDVTPEKAIEEFRKLSPWDPLEAKNLMARLRVVTPWNQSAVTRQVLDLKSALANPRGEPQAIILLSDCLDNRFEQDATLPIKTTIGEALRSAFDDGSTTLHVLTVPVVRKEDVAVQEKFAITKQHRSPGLFVPLDKYREVSDWIAASTGPRLKATLLNTKTQRLERLSSGRIGADLWSVLVPAGEYRLGLQGLTTDTTVTLVDGDRLLLELRDGKVPNWQRVDPFAEYKLLVRDGNVAVVRQRRLGEQSHTQLLIEDIHVSDIWMEESEGASLQWTQASGWPSHAWDVFSSTVGSRRLQVWPSATKRFRAEGTAHVSTDSMNEKRIALADGELVIEAPTWETVANSTEPKLVLRWISPKDHPMIVRPASVTADYDCRLYREANRGTLILPTVQRDSNTSVEVEIITLRSIKEQTPLKTLTVPAAASSLPFSPPIAR